MTALPAMDDIIAVIWFLLLWFAYSVVADGKNGGGLVNVMHRYRIQWIKRLIKKEDRLNDLRVMESLIQATVFMASTSILIAGGFVAMLGYGKPALAIMNDLPFTIETSLYMWVVKTLFALVIFIHSFFKFTWVIRQFNYTCVIMMAAPVYKNGDKDMKKAKRAARYMVRIATMITNAGRHFNMGVRSYYFGLVSLSWYISPSLFMILSVLVILVLYRREFMSRTLTMLE